MTSKVEALRLERSVVVVRSESSPWSSVAARCFHSVGYDVVELSFPVTDPSVVGGIWPRAKSLLRLGRKIALGRREIAKVGADLVVALYGGFFAVVATLLTTGSRSRSVVFIAGSDVYMANGVKGRFLFSVYRRVHLLLAANDDLAAILRGRGCTNVHVWHHGIDVDSLAEANAHTVRGDSGGKLRLLALRRLEPLYRNELLVRAVGQIRDCSVHLTFAAGGPETQRLEDLAAEVLDGTTHSVSFLGGYKAHELAEIANSHDVYVSTSPWDGKSNSLMEALVLGLYPIVEDHPANRALLGPDSTKYPGGLIDFLDPKALGRALERFQTDSSNSGCAEQRQRAALDFSWQKSAAELQFILADSK